MSTQGLAILESLFNVMGIIAMLTMKFIRYFVMLMFQMYNYVIEANSDLPRGSNENIALSYVLTAVTIIAILLILKHIFHPNHLHMTAAVQEVLDYYTNPTPVEIETFFRYYHIYTRKIKPYRILDGTYVIHNTTEDMVRSNTASDVFEAAYEELQSNSIRRARRRNDSINITIYNTQQYPYRYY